MKRLLQLAALTIGLTLAGQAAMALPGQPHYCGDPCLPDGERAGCRCEGFRTICTCVNGHWVDF